MRVPCSDWQLSVPVWYWLELHLALLYKPDETSGVATNWAISIGKCTKLYNLGMQATQELFQDGLVRTGDIMEQHASNKLIWIDRRSNIMKLAQGEFVSVSRLEQEYIGASAMIHQMFIYGTSVRSYLLAIVVPSAGAMEP